MTCGKGGPHSGSWWFHGKDGVGGSIRRGAPRIADQRKRWSASRLGLVQLVRAGQLGVRIGAAARLPGREHLPVYQFGSSTPSPEAAWSRGGSGRRSCGGGRPGRQASRAAPASSATATVTCSGSWSWARSVMVVRWVVFGTAVGFWSSFLADARYRPHGRHQAGTATATSTGTGTTLGQSTSTTSTWTSGSPPAAHARPRAWARAGAAAPACPGPWRLVR